MAAAPIAVLLGTITVPPSFPEPQVHVNQQLGSSAGVELYTGFIGQFDVNIPVIAGGKSTLHATSSLNGATTSFAHPELNATTDASFALPAPAALATPAAAATGVNLTTDFTWTVPASTVRGVSISTSGTTKVTYIVYTTAMTTRIPNIPEVPLPAGQTYAWSVSGYAPNTSVDQVAIPGGPEFASKTDYVGPRHSYTTSASRSFTAQ
jgi:hypothetical protein